MTVIERLNADESLPGITRKRMWALWVPFTETFRAIHALKKGLLSGGPEGFPLYDPPVEKVVAGRIKGSRCCDFAAGVRDFFLRPAQSRAKI